MTGTTRRTTVPAPVASTAARALLAALLAVVTTFWPQPDRTAGFGLTVLGVFLVAQAVVLAVVALRGRRDRTGRVLTALRSAVSLVAGAVALLGADRGVALLVPLAALAFLAVGALELADGVRRRGAGVGGDAIVVGGLQVLLGVLLVVLLPGSLLAIGVLTAWSAVVAVYLGISAANLRRRGVPT